MPETGQYVAAIHAMTANDLPRKYPKPFGRYANVIRGQGGATWQEAILAEVNQWRTVVEPAGIFTGEEMNAVELAFHGNSRVLEAITGPYLAHGDLWYGNILVDPQNRLTAIIDGDRAVFGDPEFELATGWMISDSFLEGYGKGLDPNPDAVLRRRLYKLLLSIEDCYILFCEYGNPEAGAELKQWILKEAAKLNLENEGR